MPKITFMPFQNPKKKKCNCCDRTMLLKHRVLLLEDESLVGDLELCTDCAQALAEIFNQSQPETVEREWYFQGQ